jgi:hypothetical protein
VTKYGGVVRGFGYVTLSVLIVVGIGVGVVGGLNPLGTVQGRLVVEPAPGTLAVYAGGGTVGVVQVVHASQVVATAEVGQSDKFSLHLPPGQYGLRSTWVTFKCTATHVQVKANKTVSVSVSCPVTFSPIGQTSG